MLSAAEVEVSVVLDEGQSIIYAANESVILEDIVEALMWATDKLWPQPQYAGQFDVTSD